MVVCLGSIMLVVKQFGLLQLIVILQICVLEEVYGVELFYWGGCWLSLFDVGVWLMLLVDQFVCQEIEIDFFLCNFGDMGLGYLCIGVMVLYYVFDIVDCFCKSYFGIDVSIEVGNLVQMFEVLQEYWVDVVLLLQWVDDVCFLCIELVCDLFVLVVYCSYVFVDWMSVFVSVLL